MPSHLNPLMCYDNLLAEFNDRYDYSIWNDDIKLLDTVYQDQKIRDTISDLLKKHCNVCKAANSHPPPIKNGLITHITFLIHLYRRNPKQETCQQPSAKLSPIETKNRWTQMKPTPTTATDSQTDSPQVVLRPRTKASQTDALNETKATTTDITVQTDTPDDPSADSTETASQTEQLTTTTNASTGTIKTYARDNCTMTEPSIHYQLQSREKSE